MISEAGLVVLDAVSAGREATPTELAAETEYSRVHLYDVLDELLETGIVTETRGSKNQRRVRVADHPVVEAYRDLRSKLGHVEWAKILSPATLRVCWFLDEPRRAAEIADRLDITRQGVHRALSPVKNRAMLSPSGPEYALSEDLTPLLNFARAVVRQDHRSRAREVAPSATVEWCDPNRALIRVQTADDTTALQASSDWTVTGLGKFQAYSLEFFLAGEPAFWYAPDEELTPAEVVCHTLVLDKESRRVSYSMLLIEKENIEKETLTTIAKWYDLEAVISAIYHALHGEFDVPDNSPIFPPSESEYMALKEQYGVA